MEILIVKKDTLEWNFMFLWLQLNVIDLEDWEYTCSYRQHNKTYHEFKYRNHVMTHKHVEASESLTEEQIEKYIKINRK